MCVCRSVGRVCAHHRTRSVRMEQRKYSRVWAVDLRFHDSDMTRRRTKTATDRESRRRASNEHDAEHGQKCRKMRLLGPKMGPLGTPLEKYVFGAQFSVVRFIWPVIAFRERELLKCQETKQFCDCAKKCTLATSGRPFSRMGPAKCVPFHREKPLLRKVTFFDVSGRGAFSEKVASKL